VSTLNGLKETIDNLLFRIDKLESDSLEIERTTNEMEEERLGNLASDVMNFRNEIMENLDATKRHQRDLVDEVIVRFKEVIDNVNMNERKCALRENVLLGIVDGTKDQMTEISKLLKLLSTRYEELKGKISNINGQVGATMGIMSGKMVQIANSNREQQIAISNLYKEGKLSKKVLKKW
jgi:hypothetical protein